MRRDKELSVRMSERSRRVMDQAARHLDMPASRFVRDTMLEIAKQIIVKAEGEYNNDLLIALEYNQESMRETEKRMAEFLEK